MRHNRHYTWIAACLVGLVFAACYDKENTIHRLPDMVIANVSGGEIGTGEMVDITPVTTMNGEEVECTYRWFRYHGTVPELISEESRLQYRVDTIVSITFGVEATHEATGMMQTQTFSYTIVPRVNRGWIILKETADGNTDMDASLTQGGDTIEFVSDMLTTALGAPMQGAPVSVLYTPAFTYDNPETGVSEAEQACVVPVSEREVLMYRVNDERVLARTEDLFYELPDEASRHIEAFSSISGNMTLIIDGKAHLQPRDGKAFMPALYGDYSLAPFLVNPENVSNSLVYDEQAGSFAVVVPSGLYSMTTELSYFPERYRETDDLQISPSNMDSELIFMGQTTRSVNPDYSYVHTVFALMRPNGDAGTLRLYGLSSNEFSSASDMWGPIRFAREIDVSRCPDFADADFYTLHPLNNELYFIKDNVLSCYDIDSDEFRMGIYTFPGEVTYCKFLNQTYDADMWGNPPFDYSFTRLLVAASSGGNYTVYVFDHTDGTESWTPDTSITGEGRVRFMFWYSPQLFTDAYGYGLLYCYN